MDKLVDIKPSELRFTVTAGVQSTVTLRLRSVVTDALLFKFKTTAPLRYAVQPNASVIAPGTTADIVVVLKTFKSLPPDMTNWRDKFMLQIARVDAVHASLSDEDVIERWRVMPPEAIVRQKFQCRLGLAPISPIPEGEEEALAGVAAAPPRAAAPPPGLGDLAAASADTVDAAPASHHFRTPRALDGAGGGRFGGEVGANGLIITEEDVEEEDEEDSLSEEEEVAVADVPPARGAAPPPPSLPATPATLVAAGAVRDRAWEQVAANQPHYKAAAGPASPGADHPPTSMGAFPDAPTFPSLSAFAPADDVTPVPPPALSSADVDPSVGTAPAATAEVPPPESAAAKLFVTVSSTLLAAVFRVQHMVKERQEAAAAAKARKAQPDAALTPIPPRADTLKPPAPAAVPPPVAAAAAPAAADTAAAAGGPPKKRSSFLRGPPPSSIPPLLAAPSAAPVPREALQRAAVARAAASAAALRESEAELVRLRAELEAAKHRKADAADAVRPLYAARFAVATDAPPPFVDVALMLIITAGLLKLTFLPPSA